MTWKIINMVRAAAAATAAAAAAASDPPRDSVAGLP